MSVSSFGLNLAIDPTRPAAQSPTYTQIMGIVEGSLPEITKDTYETKTLDQTTRAKGFAGSFYEGGELTFKIVYARANQGALYGYVKDPASYPCKITIADAKPGTGAVASTITFMALFTKIGTPMPEGGDRMVNDVTIKVDGDVTFNAGTDGT